MASRTLTVLHFNDCYDLNARQNEPVGGAARMVGLAASALPAKLPPLLPLLLPCTPA